MAGKGGSENYTIGQVRELMRRGIPTRIITIGYGEEDGRDDFPDITFTSLRSKEELSRLDDTLVFVTYPLNVQTKKQSYAILHCAPITHGDVDPMYDRKAFAGKQLITPSKFAAKLWAEFLGINQSSIKVAYPFAEMDFSVTQRDRSPKDETRILFAGRLDADKGIYTFLASLHMDSLQKLRTKITVTSAGDHTPQGKIIKKLLLAHPTITVVPAARNSQEMASLMSRHDVVVIPSTAQSWQETFGITSVEAQHAGCQVVASKAGGLPETDCGGLLLVAPDNPSALAKGVAKASKIGPLTILERKIAALRFTAKNSVDSLLKIVQDPSLVKRQKTKLLREEVIEKLHSRKYLSV